MYIMLLYNIKTRIFVRRIQIVVGCQTHDCIVLCNRQALRCCFQVLEQSRLVGLAPGMKRVVGFKLLVVAEKIH